MSDEKKKLEKVLITDPRVLMANVAWLEMVEHWPIPGDEEKETRPTMVIYLPYSSMEDLAGLRKVLAMNREEVNSAAEQQRSAMSLMKEAGVDVDSMGAGYEGEPHEHNCEGCPAYDECDLPIKKELEPGKGDGGPLLN